AAEQRLKLLGINNVRLHCLVSAWAQDSSHVAAFVGEREAVDVVLLVALLEHMTIDERLNTLRGVWEQLRPGGVIVLYTPPNRLNCFHWHRLLPPFCDSLPDGLAIAYADHSPRPFFKIHPEGNLVDNLYRLGRGVSFHEFDLALGLEQLRVINDGFSSKL